ncbi:ribose-phosphate diphosphokinase [Patescibacteria group bacterium]
MKKLLFNTNSNPDLARTLTRRTELTIGNCEIKKFADQEVSVYLKEDVTNQSVCVLGSTFPPADNILELLILIHTLKANRVKEIDLIIPYFAYAKADKVKPRGASMTAQLMTQAIELAGADKITAINLHSKLTEEFFTKPLEHLSATPLLAEYFKKSKFEKIAVASPDLGGVSRAQHFAKELGINEIIRIEKHRPAFDELEITQISGEVKGKNIVIVDDMTQSGGTLIKAAQALKKQGAKKIYVAITHLVSTGPCVSALEHERSIKKVITTDTIPSQKRLSSKFEILPIASLLSNAIKKQL